MSRFHSEPVLRVILPERLKALGLSGAWFEVVEDFTYSSDSFGEITVQAGFRSDLASIPRLALGWLNSDDPRISAISIVHDWLYTEKTGSRFDADLVLREGMLALGARETMADLVFLAVHFFGGSHWESK
jgi:hypothetical protein